MVNCRCSFFGVSLWSSITRVAVRLTAIHFTAFVARAAAPPKIASVLQSLVNSHALAGAVTLVASPDKVLSLEAFGQ